MLRHATGLANRLPRDADFLANYDRRQATKHTGRRSEISFVRWPLGIKFRRFSVAHQLLVRAG